MPTELSRPQERNPSPRLEATLNLGPKSAKRGTPALLPLRPCSGLGHFSERGKDYRTGGSRTGGARSSEGRRGACAGQCVCLRQHRPGQLRQGRTEPGPCACARSTTGSRGQRQSQGEGSGSLAKITGSQLAFSNSFTKAPFLANSVLCVSCALANSFIQQIFIKHLLSRDPLVGVWDTKVKKKEVPKTWHSVFTK